MKQLIKNVTKKYNFLLIKHDSVSEDHVNSFSNCSYTAHLFSFVEIKMFKKHFIISNTHLFTISGYNTECACFTYYRKFLFNNTFLNSTIK